MIILNNRKFASNESEFSHEFSGFYKVNKRTISILNTKKEKIGCINEYGLLISATKRESGYWYSFATIKEIGEYKSFMQSVEEPRKIYTELLTCQKNIR